MLLAKRISIYLASFGATFKMYQHLEIVQAIAEIHAREEIDAIMEEMEDKTPKPGEANQTFEILNGAVALAEIVETISDDVDAKGFFANLFTKEPPKPGKLHPSRPTNDRYYDFTNENVGIALIFNQVRFKNEQERKGSNKDAEDLREVLSNIGFDVRLHTDFTVQQIKNEVLNSKSLFYLNKANE